MNRHSKQTLKFDGKREPTDEQIHLSRAFFSHKWRERKTAKREALSRSAMSAELIGRHVDDGFDTAGGCKLAALMAALIFGGEIQGNWHHEFVVTKDGQRIDLTEYGARTEEGGDVLDLHARYLTHCGYNVEYAEDCVTVTFWGITPTRIVNRDGLYVNDKTFMLSLEHRESQFTWSDRAQEWANQFLFEHPQ